MNSKKKMIHQETSSTKTTDDETLARQWAGGDFEAAEVLYQRYERKLLFFFFLQTGHYEDARDLLGETFSRVAQNIASFRFESSFRSWLFRIGRHLLTDHFYRKKLDQDSLSNLSKEREEVILEVLGDEEALYQCLEELTDRARTAVYLTHGEDYVLREVAELLGLSMEGVRKINLCSLEILKRCLVKKGCSLE